MISAAMFSMTLLGAFGPCELDEMAAECGTIRVPEDRSKPAARSIDLNVAIIPAQKGKRSAGAIFVLAGGPGQGAMNLGGYAARQFKDSGRDLVFSDMRGTGKSNPLHCELGGSNDDLQGYFNDMLPADHLARCRDQLAGRADFSQYNTTAAADDVEEVRKQLGYATIDLYGTSYGTRLAQEVMRRHPKSVRAAVLDGVVPPSLASPSTFAADAQRSLEAVFALARPEFPELDKNWAAVLKDASDGLELEVENPKTKKLQRVKISRGLFGEIMRNFLYSPEVYTQLPRVIRDAAHGKWTAFAEMGLRYVRGIHTLQFGLFLSVTCAEDIPRIDEPAARKSAEGTMLGAYRIDQQLAACRVWHRVPKIESPGPLKSSIPTVIVSGEFDPVTPPRFGEEVARSLSNAVHVVIPAGSHSGDTGGCLERVLSEFVREGSTATLDRSCIDQIKRPSFAK